jgi:heat shock protein HslJ
MMNAHTSVAVFTGVAICLAASLAFTQQRLTITGDRLEFFDAAGSRVAVFTAVVQVSAPSASPELARTSWQLVKFQGSDEKTLTPDDGAKYTIDFAAGGRLTARIDCNRGSGTWKSSGPSLLQFGPLALTRAKCPLGPCTIRS